MTVLHRLWITAVTLLVASCASTPVHYHTLVPAPVGQSSHVSIASSEVEVQPVRIPAGVDRMELVARQRDGEISLVDSELWIAPLADELRGAVSLELLRQLGSTDARHKLSAISVRLDVERFESAPARYALIEAAWQVRIKSPMRAAVVACRSRVSESVSRGYVALVRGHQRAIALIADQMAVAALRLATEDVAACPVERD